VLWIFGSGKGRLPRPPEPDEIEGRRQINDLLANFQAATGGVEKDFIFDDSANVAWDTWDEALYEQGKDLNPDDKHLAQRLQALAIRIAVIFTASDGIHIISDYHLTPAIKFVEWQFENVRRESRMWGSNDDARLGSAVVDVLMQKPRRREEIFALMPRWGPLMLRRSIENLLGLGTVTEDLKTGILYATRLGVEEKATA
jgi:hypothetical protein